MIVGIRQHQSRACRLITLVVMLSLCAFSFIVYFYAHLHVLADGRILVHSHALPKGERTNNSHTHTNLELLILDQQIEIKALLFTALILYLSTATVAPLLSSDTQFATQVSYALFSRRAPPITL